MSSAIDNGLDSIYQEIVGDIVFPMVSGIFKDFNHDFLQAKSSGYSSEEAKSIAIGEVVQLPGLADDFEPLDRSPTPPPPNYRKSWGELCDFFGGMQPIFRRYLYGLRPLKSYEINTLKIQ